jgi:arsenical pump membrane protein
MILTLGDYGVTDIISRALGDSLPVFTYGFSSFLAANVVNNIPMSVLFASVIPEGAVISEAATYATVIGSNIGAIFTPIGALAGIMWCSILSKHQLRFDYLDFLKMGIAVAIATLSASLIGLYIVL